MKITSLEIENFRSIRHVHLKNIPNFVVIVGSNGVGKSSILEAIRFVKIRHFPYHHDESRWRSQSDEQRNLIRQKQNNAKIILEIEPTNDRERKILGNNKTAKLGVIYRNGSFENFQEGGAQALFLRPTETGENESIMEYIEAYRVFQEGKANLEVGAKTEEFFLRARTGPNTRDKFSRLKQKILSVAADDLLIEGGEKRFPEIVELIKKLLGREIIVKFQKGAIGDILVKNEDGDLELDALSSGEREILMTYFTLHDLKLKNSIVLFDEPDLHLHATSQRAALSYLKKMTDDNQIFLTTHASEIIFATPDESLFHLRRTDKDQLVNVKDESEKLQIHEELGGSKFGFLTFDKTVFVEGPTDEKILSKIETNGLSLKFEIFHGGMHITPEILEMISKLGKVAMIKDRDFYTDDEIQKMRAKAPDKLYFWSRREIENFFLDSKILFDIYSTIGKRQYSTLPDFIESIRRISENYVQQTITDKFLFEQNSKINPPQPRLPSGKTASSAIKEYYATRNERTSKLIAELDTKIVPMEQNMKSNWAANWIIDVDPKMILTEIGQTYFTNQKSLEDLIDMLILKLESNDKFPEELVTTIQTIAKL